MRRAQARRPPEIGAAEAQVLAYYGAGALQLRGDLTRDGFIPLRLFWYYWRQIPSVLALQAFNTARAVALGIGLGVGNDRAQSAMEDLQEQSDGRT